MKKTSILTLMLALTLIFAACSNTPAMGTGVADTTVNLIDKYTAPSEDPPEIPENFVIPEGYTYEMEYRYFPDGDNSYGIRYAPSTMEILGERLYYRSELVLSYLDVKTGQTFAVCPDPICPHTSESGCQFIGLNIPIHHPENYDIVFTVQGYTVAMENHMNICVVDEKQGTVTKVYGTDVKGSEDGGSIFLRFLSGDKLYFSRHYEESTMDEHGKINTEIVSRLFAMDINTYEVKQVDNNSGDVEAKNVLISGDNHLLCVSKGQVKVADINFENEKILLEFDTDTFFIKDYYYDSVTDEFYFSLLTEVLLGNTYDGPAEGYIYRVDSNMNCEKLDISDKIINFTLTRNFIYFTQYEPIELGETMYGDRCAVVNGGKFYRVKRDGIGEIELVFDGGVELNHFIHNPLVVFGDYLYYNWAYIVKQTDGSVNFKVAKDYVRIGITDKTVKSIILG